MSPCARVRRRGKNHSDLLQSSPWPGAPVTSVILQRADLQGTQGIGMLQESCPDFPFVVSHFSFFFLFTTSERHRRKPLSGRLNSYSCFQIRNNWEKKKKQLETRENRLKARTWRQPQHHTWELVSGLTWKLVRNAVFQDPSQTYGIRICILTSPPLPSWFLYTIRFEKLGKGKLYKRTQVLPHRDGPLCEILGSQRHLVVSSVVAVVLSGRQAASEGGRFIHHWSDRWPCTRAQRSPRSASLHHAGN